MNFLTYLSLNLSIENPNLLPANMELEYGKKTWRFDRRIRGIRGNKIANQHPAAPKSVLDGDKEFVKKILSRSQTKYSTSSTYFESKSFHIPFAWESQPGQPKHHPQERSSSSFTKKFEDLLNEDDQEQEQEKEGCDSSVTSPPPPKSHPDSKSKSIFGFLNKVVQKVRNYKFNNHI